MCRFGLTYMIMLIIATRKQTEHKNFENNFDLSSESEIKPQQRTCVCLDRIALLQNFMNRDSPKERQQLRLNKKKILSSSFIYHPTGRFR